MPDPITLSLPRLQYHLSNPSSQQYGWITVGGERVHRVANVDDFFRALGYTEEVRRCGLLPDEFIWFEYTKDNCPKSPAELQARIAQYLEKHSAVFRERYGDKCDQLLAALV